MLHLRPIRMVAAFYGCLCHADLQTRRCFDPVVGGLERNIYFDHVLCIHGVGTPFEQRQRTDRLLIRINTEGNKHIIGLQHRLRHPKSISGHRVFVLEFLILPQGIPWERCPCHAVAIAIDDLENIGVHDLHPHQIIGVEDMDLADNRYATSTFIEVSLSRIGRIEDLR